MKSDTYRDGAIIEESFRQYHGLRIMTQRKNTKANRPLLMDKSVCSHDERTEPLKSWAARRKTESDGVEGVEKKRNARFSSV